jgi:phage-related protein
MSKVRVVFYQSKDGEVPVLEWLEQLPRKVQDKCTVKIERLSELGHELRRPEADLLRDKIYELRIGYQGANYRILYFFHGKLAVVLAHGLMKEREVPPKEIDRAVERRNQFEKDPEGHTFTEDER